MRADFGGLWAEMESHAPERHAAEKSLLTELALCLATEQVCRRRGTTLRQQIRVWSPFA